MLHHGVVDQLIDQVTQMMRQLAQPGDVPQPAALVALHRQQFHLRYQRRHGRPQLMGGVADDTAHQFAVHGKAMHELVDRTHQWMDFCRYFYAQRRQVMQVAALNREPDIF